MFSANGVACGVDVRQWNATTAARIRRVTRKPAPRTAMTTTKVSEGSSPSVSSLVLLPSPLLMLSWPAPIPVLLVVVGAPVIGAAVVGASVADLTVAEASVAGATVVAAAAAVAVAWVPVFGGMVLVGLPVVPDSMDVAGLDVGSGVGVDSRVVTRVGVDVCTFESGGSVGDGLLPTETSLVSVVVTGLEGAAGVNVEAVVFGATVFTAMVVSGVTGHLALQGPHSFIRSRRPFRIRTTRCCYYLKDRDSRPKL